MPGGMDELARRLAGSFRVIEPAQRRSGGAPLTVAGHVEDMHALIEAEGPATGRPALVGHSWGAMLALAIAAAHPALVGPIALIGCGTFSAAARATLRREVDRRMDGDLRRRLRHLDEAVADVDARFAAMGLMLAPVYSHELTALPRIGRCDRRGHEETWADMLRLQATGVYPAAFGAITAPILMLHGKDDPHPGAMIRDDLRRVMPQSEYVEFERCGHYPWLERAAKEEFLDALCRWLEAHAS